MSKLYRLPMRRLYGPLRWVWIAFVLVLVTTLVGRWLSGGLLEGEGFALRPGVWGDVRTFGPWVILFLLVLAVLTILAWGDRKVHESFDLLTPTKELRPEDLNFQALKPGEHLTQDRRPFYEATYISRIAIPYDLRANENPHPRYDEEALIRSLQEKSGFVLLGPPLEGKSRILYEIVRRMDGYEVLRPHPKKGVPDDDSFSLLLKGRPVVLLLDDLTKYVDSELDLQLFGQRLGEHASSWVVASTCRDGPELGAVREAVGKSLKRFYDDIPNKRLRQ